MKHICFIFCLLFTMSFNAVKETSAFDNESFQNEVGNRLPGILDKHTFDYLNQIGYSREKIENVKRNIRRIFQESD